MAKYIPKQGDIVYLNFTPQSGHEQRGKRPALIVSNAIFNKGVGLSVACPITNTDRNSPFHIQIDNHKSTGFVMCEQVKSLDYNKREISFIEKASDDILQEALAIIESMFQVIK